MSLLPEFDEEMEATDLSDDAAPDFGSKTYAIDFGTGRLLPVLLEGEAAIAQSLSVMFQTERGLHPIFGEDYGIEADDIIAAALPRDVFELELSEEISDAATTDDRVDSVEDVEYRYDSLDGDRVYVGVAVKIVDGEDIIVTREVVTG